jgi:DNA-binding XRE family transcriptional regulator
MPSVDDLITGTGFWHPSGLSADAEFVNPTGLVHESGRCNGQSAMLPIVPRSEPSETLATVLRELREDVGESQKGLAYRSGITTGALARIELGRSSPAFVTVQKIAAALDVSLADLATLLDAADRRVCAGNGSAMSAGRPSHY